MEAIRIVGVARKRESRWMNVVALYRARASEDEVVQSLPKLTRAQLDPLVELGSAAAKISTRPSAQFAPQ